eukprot:1442546-Alexandrium_andersonii.AAC.1
MAPGTCQRVCGLAVVRCGLCFMFSAVRQAAACEWRWGAHGAAMGLRRWQQRRCCLLYTSPSPRD